MLSSRLDDLFVFSGQFVCTKNGLLASVRPVNESILDCYEDGALNPVFDNDSAILTFEAGALDSLEADVGPEEDVVVGVDREVTGFAQ